MSAQLLVMIMSVCHIITVSADADYVELSPEMLTHNMQSHSTQGTRCTFCYDDIVHVHIHVASTCSSERRCHATLLMLTMWSYH